MLTVSYCTTCPLESVLPAFPVEEYSMVILHSWEERFVTHLILCLIDANEKEELRDEEIDAEIFVDGVAVSLQSTQKAEGGDANGQADQGNHNAHPRDDREQQLIDAALVLKEEEK